MTQRILVVDDSPFIQELTKDILTKAGFAVDKASNGHEAMLSIGENPPDLVLLDIIMPEMSGYQVCRLIRDDERLRGLPVVMMTAKDTQKDRFWGLEVGADAYITKPVEERNLLEIISSLLKEDRPAIRPVRPEELTSEALKDRAQEILERKLLELTIINETGKLFTYLDRPDALLESVLGLLCQVVDFDLGVIFVALPGADHKFVALRYRNKPLKISKKEIIRRGVQNLAAGRNLPFDSIAGLETRLIEESELGKEKTRKPVSSELEVVLRSSRGVLGSLMLFSSRKDFFIPDDRALVEMITTQISILLDNVQLLHDRDRQLSVLELEKNRVEAILRNMGEGVIVTDWSYRIIHANPMANQLLGAEGDLVGTHLFERIPQETFSILQEQKIGVNNPTWTVRFRSIAEAFPLVASVAVVDEKEKQTLGLILLLRDTSGEQEIDHLKNRFLENVSTHLRNPLTSLKGFLDLLGEEFYEQAPSRQREYYDVISEETGRLTEIVEDLLSLTKIELTGHRPLPEVFPVAEIISSAIENNQSSAHARGIKIRSQIAPDLPRVRAEKDSILDVTNRLLSNAVKYNPPNREVVVGAALAAPSETGGSVEVFVRDYGPGVPEGRKGVIFEKYQEHHLFSDSDSPGVGLGLPICKKLVEINGGRIGVEPAEGGGSRFFFTVPSGSGL